MATIPELLAKIEKAKKNSLMPEGLKKTYIEKANAEIKAHPDYKKYMEEQFGADFMKSKDKGAKKTYPEKSDPYEAFDIDELDEFERRQYDHFIKQSSKKEVLNILINTVEGDHTQLSSALKKLANAEKKEKKSEPKKAAPKKAVDHDDDLIDSAKNSAEDYLLSALPNEDDDKDVEESITDFRYKIADHYNDPKSVMPLIEKFEKNELEKIKSKSRIKEIKNAFQEYRASYGSSTKKKEKKSEPAKPSAKKGVDYDCDELIAKEKARKASSKKSAAKSPAKKSDAAIEKTVDAIEHKAEEGELTKDQILKLIQKLRKEIRRLENLLKTAK